MIRVDFADGGFETIIEGWEPDVLGIARLINRVVTGDPRIRGVVGGKLLPKPDGAVLVVFIVPESSVGGGVISVPPWRLATWKSVHIEDSIYPFFCALWMC